MGQHRMLIPHRIRPSLLSRYTANYIHLLTLSNRQHHKLASNHKFILLLPRNDNCHRPFRTARTDSQRRTMRIATLQFAPKLGDVEGNIKRADELLAAARRPLVAADSSKLAGKSAAVVGIDELRPDILVLPELAMTGEFQSYI